MARERADVDLHTGTTPLTREELVARLQGRQGLVALITEIIDEALLAAMSRAEGGRQRRRRVQQCRRGAPRHAGACVITNTPDVLTDTTADFAWSLLMAAARRVVEADRYVRDGRWRKWDFSLLWGARHSRQDAGHRGLRPDRTRHGTAGPRLRHARPLSGCGRRRSCRGARAQCQPRRPDDPVPRIGLRHAAYAAPPRDAAPDQCSVASGDEEDRVPRQCLPWSRGGRGGAGPGTQRRVDRGRRPRRVRERARTTPRV